MSAPLALLAPHVVLATAILVALLPSLLRRRA